MRVGVLPFIGQTYEEQSILSRSGGALLGKPHTVEMQDKSRVDLRVVMSKNQHPFSSRARNLAMLCNEDGL